MTTFTKKEQRRVLLRLLSYLKYHKGVTVFALVLLAISSAGEVIGPLLIQRFLDDYVVPQQFIAPELIELATIYLTVYIISSIVKYMEVLTFQKIALRIIQQMRVDVFTKIQTLGMRYFDDTPTGSIVSRVTNDTEAIKEMFVNVLTAFIQAFFLMIAVYIAMFSLNPTLAFWTLLVLPVLFFIVYMYRKLSGVVVMRMREKLADLNAKLSETLSGMHIVQAFRQEERFIREFEAVNEAHYKASMRNTKMNSLLLRPMIDLVYFAAIIIVLFYFGFTSFSTAVEIGVLYAFITYINRFFEPINQMMEQMAFYQQAIVAASRVFHVMDHTEEAPTQRGHAPITDGRIVFNDVTFSYDGKEPVLKNISFTVEPGQTVALVGHTGSGKSSIINILLRFYEYSQGDISIDGISIKDIDAAQLRQKIGLVLQDPFLFYGSIRSNIRLFDDTITDEDIVEAAKFVQAHPFILQLEDGYDAFVTERGSTFSSGQRQLIAFARTMATQPKILVLDEATASIDTETEVAIQQSLENMRKGRTTIAIAHRLSTIQDAALILVLHQGEIVERGTHQQLLQQRGVYYNMYELQNGERALIGQQE